jgi:membrane protein
VVSASGSGTYAIYSGFAILILFMMWMYISWLILLVGSSVAFYVQHPEYVAPTRRSGDLSIKQREALALQIMGVIAERHYKSRKPFSASDFVLRLRVQIQGVTKVLRALKEAGLITENSEEPARYLPNAPLEKTSLKQVIDAVRSEGNASMLGLGAPRRPVHGVAAVTKAIDDALDAALAATSVRDMAIEDDGSALDGAEAGKNN